MFDLILNHSVHSVHSIHSKIKIKSVYSLELFVVNTGVVVVMVVVFVDNDFALVFCFTNLALAVLTVIQLLLQLLSNFSRNSCNLRSRFNKFIKSSLVDASRIRFSLSNNISLSAILHETCRPRHEKFSPDLQS